MPLTENNDTNNFYPVTVEGTDWNCQYLWSTHEGNFKGSGCEFSCTYCSRQKYNSRFNKPAGLHRLKSEWNQIVNQNIKRWILPNGKVFICPYSDIMTLPKDDVSEIFGVIYNSCEYWFDQDVVGHKEKNNFGIILQTKDPAKYFNYLDLIPEGSWLGTTIETDSSLYNVSKAPMPEERYKVMVNIPDGFKKFITIEPILKMNNLMKKELFHERIIYWMKDIKPDLIFIGANTSKVKLPEPTPDELVELIERLKDITTVYLKSNLKRLLPTTIHSWFNAIKETSCD